MEKKRKREGEGEVPQKKRGRPKKSDSPLSARYPDIHGEALNPVAENRNTDAVAKELEKQQPRKDIILPLMKSLYSSRRQYILNDAVSASDTIDKFPALKLSFVVSLYD